MSKNESVVAVYHTHVEAEEAVKLLQRAGVDMHILSIVAKDVHTDEQVVGYYNVGDRMKRWGKSGAMFGGVWGGFWAVLFGAAFFVIPGVGPLLVAGPLVAWIVGALEGAVVVGGLSVLGAGLGPPLHSVAGVVITDHFFIGVEVLRDDRQNMHIDSGALELFYGILGLRMGVIYRYY